ncbi:hypothetical protein H6768_05865 [Candidatus Peribacteria bacterium]|nr:hypothetical protein [Candidatus Peribacteria bacterium]
MIAIGPARKRKKFAIVTRILVIHHALSVPPKNIARYRDSIKPTTTRAIVPYTNLIFADRDVCSSLPRKSIVNHPHVNMMTATAIMVISKNFTIAITLPFHQKFCGQKK